MSRPLRTVNEPLNQVFTVEVILIDKYSFVFETEAGARYAIDRPKNSSWLNKNVQNNDMLLVALIEYETSYKGSSKNYFRLELRENLTKDNNNEELETALDEVDTYDDDPGMSEFYDADFDNGMGTYLSDGMYVRADGSIYDSKG